MELAGLYDITFKRSATFSLQLEYLDENGDVDVTGATAAMQVRKSDINPNVLLELSSGNGHIAIDPTAHTITLSMTDEETAALDWTSGVYDLFLHYSDGSTDPLLEGRATVSREVTHT